MNAPVVIHTVITLFLDLALTLVLLWSLARLGASAATLRSMAAAGAGWAAVLLWVFGGRHLIPMGIGGAAFFGILLAVVAGVSALVFITPMGGHFMQGGQEWILMPQGMRALFGAGFLIQGVTGALPATFAIADGLTHIVAALTALWVAWTAAKGCAGRTALWVVNLFGLIDIVAAAIGIAFLLLPVAGPYQPVMYAAFYAAPLFIAFHLLSLRRLISTRAGAQACPVARPA